MVLHLLNWGRWVGQVWGREDQEFSLKIINFKMFIKYPSDNRAIGLAVLEFGRKLDQQFKFGGLFEQ